MNSKEKDDVVKDSYTESQNKRQSNNSLGYLPEEVIFDILTRLPAEWLHKSVRLTCKSWAAMISSSDFVKAHLLRAKPGIFIQKTRRSYGAHFLEFKGNGEYGVAALSPRLPGHYLNSCDGLILFIQKSTGNLQVVNPVTMQRLNVPKLLGSNLNCHATAAIIRVPRTGEFKLFASLVKSESLVWHCHWYVLRLGKDTTWTRFGLEAGYFTFRGTPIYCGGNDLYWIRRDHIILMDVDKETFRKFDLHGKLYHHLFKFENHLAYISPWGIIGYRMHVFEADCGRWRLHHQIEQIGSFSGYYDRATNNDSIEHSSYCVCFCFCINQEVIFKVTSGPGLKPFKAWLHSYNVETSKLSEIDVILEDLFNGNFVEGSFKLGLHTNSLVSW